MATESQWRAVIKAMAAWAAQRPGLNRAVLWIYEDGSGRLSRDGDYALAKVFELRDIAETLRALGIPIDPDPAPATTPAPYDEARARREFVDMALTSLFRDKPGCLAGWYTERLNQILEVRDRALAANEAIPRESAEKGGDNAT